MTSSATQVAVSGRRLAANRANAKKSTGPRTEAGKRASAQNARKTPPCPFTFQLPPRFAAEWLHDALRRTAACLDGRARLLLIDRCMLQAHELRWHAIECATFNTACLETDGSVDQAALWLAQRTSATQGLLSYHRWITRRINQVERSLAALAAQSAAIEEEAPKAMAAGAGGLSALPALTPADLGPDGTMPISYTANGWSFGALSGPLGGGIRAPQPPRSPQPPRPPTVGPVRGRYRLYLRCPAAAEPSNEATSPCSAIAARPTPQPGTAALSVHPKQSQTASQPAEAIQPAAETQPASCDKPPTCGELQSCGKPQPCGEPQSCGKPKSWSKPKSWGEPPVCGPAIEPAFCPDPWPQPQSTAAAPHDPAKRSQTTPTAIPSMPKPPTTQAPPQPQSRQPQNRTHPTARLQQAARSTPPPRDPVADPASDTTNQATSAASPPPAPQAHSPPQPTA